MMKDKIRILFTKIKNVNFTLPFIKKRITFRWNYKIVILLFVSLFLCGYSLISRSSIQRRFFRSHPDKVIYWDLSRDQYLSSLTNHLLARDIRFKVYTIRKGDNYWKIAKTNQVDFDTILGCNPYIRGFYADINDKIVAINRKGVLHYIKESEDPGILSRLYDIPESRIRKENKLKPFSRLRKGDILFVPDASPRMFTREFYELYCLRMKFRNPVSGWLGVPYGWRIHPILKVRKFHQGIDLGAPKYSAICAAAGGVVIVAGPAGNYGKVVILDHSDGFQTTYAHCSRIYVRTGQKVKQGQVIAAVGDTGMATIHHLHFEIKKNGHFVDPLKYLW